MTRFGIVGTVRQPQPPVAVVVSFIDAINHGDVETLAALMSADHRLQVLDDEPFVGREANEAAWRGYATAFPDYVIYPHQFVDNGDEVLVHGHTTGSHLGLADEEERQLPVTWRATVHDGAVTLWQILEVT